MRYYLISIRCTYEKTRRHYDWTIWVLYLVGSIITPSVSGPTLTGPTRTQILVSAILSELANWLIEILECNRYRLFAR